MDEKAQQALSAYHRVIRVERHPERDPGFPEIMQALRDADWYFRHIPRNEITIDQVQLSNKIRVVLMRRKHGVSST